MFEQVVVAAVPGIAVGAAYALLAHGLVLIHKGSGVLNLAHGAMAMMGAYAYWQMSTGWSWPVWVSVPGAVVATAALSSVIFFLVVWPVRHAAAVTRIVATLGLLLFFEGLALLIWGPLPKTVNSVLSPKVFALGEASLSLDAITLIVGAIVVAVVASWYFRRATAGLAVQAMEENSVAAASLGWSPRVVGALTWTAGGALAGLAGVLIAPTAVVSVETMPLLVIPALAAAMCGRMVAFGTVTAGAIVMGVVQAEVIKYASLAGSAEAVPFILIVMVVLFRRNPLPARGALRERMPSVGTGRIPLVPTAVSVAIIVALVSWVLPESLVIAVSTTVIIGIVVLSVVLLLGYAGQMSLSQLSIGGVAALVAGRLVADSGTPFLLACLVAVVAGTVVGFVFALPALRTSGVSLVVLTLGMTSVLSAMVFSNASLTGGVEGTSIGTHAVLGVHIDNFLYPRTYAVVSLVIFLLCAVAVANIRRSGSGRRLIAVRTNPRAAAALGINVVEAKLFAFALAAVIASIGGLLLALRSDTILYDQFGPVPSIMTLGYAVIGGVGFIGGAPSGATLGDGGLGSWVISSLFPHASYAWLEVFSGAVILLVALLNQDGLVGAQVKALAKLPSRGGVLRAPRGPKISFDGGDQPSARVPSRVLQLSSVTVAFGGVMALDQVDLIVRPGEVVGLIGPNGAGKTTMIDAITGFVPISAGVITLDGEDITALPPHRRTHLGISRSFQSLELFETGTVAENLAVVADGQRRYSYLVDWLLPSKSRLSPAARTAVMEFRLEPYIDEIVSELPYGIRRLVAISRAIAAEPSILLLDEPAAGLSDLETRELARIVTRLAKERGFGMLVIEHDMAFVSAVSDSLTVLDFGRMIASGDVEAVQRDPAVVEAYLGHYDSEVDSREPLVAEPVTDGGLR